MKATVPYDTSDLQLIRTFNFEASCSSVNLEEIASNQQKFSDFMNSSNTNSLVNSVLKYYGEGSVVVFNDKHLEEICLNPKLGIKNIFYMQVNELSNRAKGYIASIVNTQNIEVSTIPVVFSIVATIGQINHELNSNLNNCHKFLIVADNHDLYQRHLDDSESWDCIHLIVPNSAPTLKFGHSFEYYEQASKDAERYLLAQESIEIKIRNGEEYKLMENKVKIHA